MPVNFAIAISNAESSIWFFDPFGIAAINVHYILFYKLARGDWSCS